MKYSIRLFDYLLDEHYVVRSVIIDASNQRQSVTIMIDDLPLKERDELTFVALHQL